MRAQPVRAVRTCVRLEIDDRVDALGRDQRAMTSGVAGLSARFPPTLHAPATYAWLTGEPIGRRRFRSNRGILLAKRELALQIRDPFGLLRVLLAEPLILAAQTLDLRVTSARGRRRFGASWLWIVRRSAAPRHASEGTESRVQVQEA
jgi:hypothetical protein